MIRGTVTSAREAVVQLRLYGPGGRTHDISAVVDTGFNDFLTVPPSIVAAMNLPFAAPTKATLADGSIIAMNYHRLAVDWDGTRRPILALAAEGGPLIGMALIFGYDLFVRGSDGGEVTITQQP